MKAMLRVFFAEGMRLIHSPAAWAAMLLVPLLAAARSYLGASLALNGETDLETGLAWAPFVDGLRAGLTLTTLLLTAAAAKGLGGDLESGLVRLAVTRSVSRSALVTGRMLVGACGLAVLVLLGGLAAWLTAVSLLDFGPLVVDGFELFTAEEIREEFSAAWVAALPAMLSVWAFGLLVGSLSRSAAGAVATSLGLLLAFDLLKESLGSNARFVFAYHAPTLVDSKESALQGASALARGYSDGGVSEGMLRAAHLLPWPQTLVMIALAALFVRRRAL